MDVIFFIAFIRILFCVVYFPALWLGGIDFTEFLKILWIQFHEFLLKRPDVVVYFQNSGKMTKVLKILFCIQQSCNKTDIDVHLKTNKISKKCIES